MAEAHAQLLPSRGRHLRHELCWLECARELDERNTTGGACRAWNLRSRSAPHVWYFNAQHHVVGMVRGRFDKMTGKVTVSNDLAACGVDVSIDAASVSTQNATRDEDLRSPAFFDATAAPTIEYHGRGIRPVGEKWVLDGTLTIRGITKPVPLEVVFNGVAPAKAGQPKRVAFHATAATKRADLGMVRELLDEIGVTSEKPDVWIEIDAEALASAAR
ncbi:MAG TPA: YceI family protein [Kofleriaceae bacterium]|nr:YceI family protein [Kofleriaceae bacterium]